MERKGVKLYNDMVVPYNPMLLLKYNCHINVEVVSTVKSIKYLYKYILKGGTRAAMQLRKPGQPAVAQPTAAPTDVRDEIQQHIDGRCAFHLFHLSQYLISIVCCCIAVGSMYCIFSR